MAGIPKEFLDKIRKEVSIIEVAEQYFKLNKVSGIYQTSCIHGKDKTPSLTFFPTNTFYCFGCGAGKPPKTEGSSVIDFVVWIDNCSFIEAVQKLANMKGWEVPKGKLSKEEKQKQEMLQIAMALNRERWESLQEKKEALDYLHDRGITDEDIAKWRIGYIPEDSEHAHSGKVVFALMNDWNQTVGFSYRDMTKEFTGKSSDGAKYINSPNSLIFDKGSILYGLNFVKKDLREKGYAVIGEGFGDAIIGQKAGLPFVSIMGTSLTNKQIELLKKYTDTVILWLDGDQAGILATRRHANELRKHGFIVKVINFPGKDPDDVLMDATEEEVNEIINNAILASQFEIAGIMDRVNSDIMEVKMRAVRELKPIIEEMDNKVELEMFLTQVAKQLDISIQTLID